MSEQTNHFKDKFMSRKRLIAVLPCLFILQILCLIGSRSRTIQSLFDIVMKDFADSSSFVMKGDLSTMIQFLGRPWIFGFIIMGVIIFGFVFTLSHAIRNRKLYMTISAFLYFIIIILIVIPWILAYFFKIHLTITALSYDYLLSPNWFSLSSVIVNGILILAMAVFSIPEIVSWRKLAPRE